MIRAYGSNILDAAMNNLGEMLDYAVNACGIEPDEYWKLFLASGYAAQFSSGSAKVVTGLSGTELVWEVLDKCGLHISMPEPQTDYGRSPEFWCGWILAYYQWYTNLSFKEIYRYITIRDVLKLYPTLHEASEDKFVDTINRMIRSKEPATNLQRRRRSIGLSQKELATRAGISLRTLQQYEARARDINKAAAASLSALARVLSCQIEDILEYDFTEVESG